jgi:hypothetical protein
MRNGSGARGGAGTECSPYGRADAPAVRAVWFVAASLTAGFCDLGPTFVQPGRMKDGLSCRF